jgi:glycosyltransferase involved in cell wall biosynthesis
MWRASKPRVEQLHREQPIDAVLSYWVHPDGDAGLQAAQFCRVPSAVIVGGSDVLIMPKSPRRRREIQRVLRETDIVLTVSDGLRQAVIDLGIDPSKVHTAYQGMETRAFHRGSQSAAREKLKLPAHAKVLVWVGRMVDVKRLDLLIEAFRSVAAARPQAMLCLIGSGPLLEECRERVEEADLEERVRFVGSVTPEQLGDWYRAADRTVLSSDSEGLPNVLRESLACGTPYITTDVGNIREIDQGRFGRFVPRRDVKQLSAEIIAALDETGGPMQDDSYIPRTWRDMADQVTSLLETARGRGDDAASPESLARAAPAKSRTLQLVHHSAAR